MQVNMYGDRYMWRAIEHVLTSPNATFILLFVVFILVVGWILSKTGLLNIHTKAVTIGAANKEREVIRQQVEWIKYHYDGLEASLPKPKDYDEWRGKFITEKVYDEYVDWITFNHISTSDSYVEVKQDKIVNLVRKYTVKEEFKSKEFEDMLRKDVKECIERLVQIRELYE